METKPEVIAIVNPPVTYTSLTSSPEVRTSLSAVFQGYLNSKKLDPFAHKKPIAAKMISYLLMSGSIPYSPNALHSALLVVYYFLAEALKIARSNEIKISDLAIDKKPILNKTGDLIPDMLAWLELNLFQSTVAAEKNINIRIQTAMQNVQKLLSDVKKISGFKEPHPVQEVKIKSTMALLGHVMKKATEVKAHASKIAAALELADAAFTLTDSSEAVITLVKKINNVVRAVARAKGTSAKSLVLEKLLVDIRDELLMTTVLNGLEKNPDKLSDIQRLQLLSELCDTYVDASRCVVPLLKTFLDRAAYEAKILEYTEKYIDFVFNPKVQAHRDEKTADHIYNDHANIQLALTELLNQPDINHERRIELENYQLIAQLTHDNLVTKHGPARAFGPMASFQPTARIPKLDSTSMKIMKVLGAGSFGVVYKAEIKGTAYAVKEALGHSGPGLVAEAELMADLNESPYVIKLIGVSLSSAGLPRVVIEFAELGTLADAFNNKVFDWSWTQSSTRLQAVANIAAGVMYIHGEGVVHRDLKSENVLVSTQGDTISCKLADFGLAVRVTNPDHRTVGTPLWMAPEVLNRTNRPALVTNTDIYSLGIVMWEIAALDNKPYKQKLELKQFIAQVTQFGLRPVIPSDCPADYIKIMKKAWDQDPKQRPTARELVASINRLGTFKPTYQPIALPADSANAVQTMSSPAQGAPAARPNGQSASRQDYPEVEIPHPGVRNG